MSASSESTISKGGRHYRHSKAKKVYVHANLNAARQVVPIEGTDYVIEYTLSEDKKMEIRKGHFRDISQPPKLDFKSTKSTDLRDEYSAYCGQKKYIKNWLYYA